MPYKIDCEIDKITLKSNAVQKESTTNPPTIFVHSNIIKALITNRNKPKVTMVKGKVSNTIIGFINIFSNPRTKATIIDVVNPST